MAASITMAGALHRQVPEWGPLKPLPNLSSSTERPKKGRRPAVNPGSTALRCQLRGPDSPRLLGSICRGRLGQSVSFQTHHRKNDNPDNNWLVCRTSQARFWARSLPYSSSNPQGLGKPWSARQALTRTRRWSPWLRRTMSLKLHGNPGESSTAILTSQWGNWSTETLSNLPKVTQQTHTRAGI